MVQSENRQSAKGSIPVVEVFTKYLELTAFGQALMISGPWGCGKSHLFKSSLHSIATQKSFKVLYVSLHGLSSSSQIDQLLFSAAYPLVKNGFVQAAGALFKDALGVTGISLNDLLKIEAAIDPNTLVCFDDLERMNPSLITAVWGKVSHLLEEKNAKVCILCDESKIITNADYITNKEKIIGRTISFTPTAEDIGKTVISLFLESKRFSFSNVFSVNTNDSEWRSSVEDALTVALRKADCHNVRIAISVVNDFLDFASRFPSKEKAFSDDTYLRIFHTFVVTAIQLKVNPHSRSAIEKLFSPNHDDFYFLDRQKPDVVLADDFFNQRLQSIAYPAVICHEIFLFIADGHCDYKLLFQQLDSVFGSKDFLEKGMEPEKILQSYRRLSQADFEAALKSTLDKLENQRYTTLTELKSLAATLFHLSEIGLLSSSPTTSPGFKIDNTYLFERIIEAAKEITRLALQSDEPIEATDFNSHGSVVNQTHSRVIENLKEYSYEIQQANWSKRKSGLYSALISNPELFCKQLLDNDDIFARSAVFSDETDVDRMIYGFKKILQLPHPSGAIFRLAKAFRSRYAPQDMKSIADSERHLLMKVVEKIDRLVEKTPQQQSLTVTALNELSEAFPASSSN